MHYNFELVIIDMYLQYKIFIYFVFILFLYCYSYNMVESNLSEKKIGENKFRSELNKGKS